MCGTIWGIVFAKNRLIFWCATAIATTYSATMWFSFLVFILGSTDVLPKPLAGALLEGEWGYVWSQIAGLLDL